MLLNKAKIQPAIINAVTVPMSFQPTGVDYPKVSRFKTVLDNRGHECGAVTKHYRLVNNGDLVAAVDLASDKLGLDLECGTARYVNGKFRATFWMNDEFRVPGDASGVRPQIELGNSYGGTAALSGGATSAEVDWV